MPEASGSGVTDEPILYENKNVLAEDMKFLAGMPELCDVTFLVGDTREPVCAVKAVLAARSRVFHKMLYQAPSPQRKKDPPTRENKIRMFLKRSSEPLLNLQNAAQQRSGFTQQLAPIQEPNQHTTLIIEEFEPDVFRQVIEYIHTGCIMLQPRTLLGVMNAADYYGLNQLRSACAGFAQCCITVDTVCALLASAERYIQYKCTKSLVQKVLEFVDEHGNEVLNLGSFTLLPQHVVLLILAREELRADEFTKFQAALMWSKKFCDSNQTAVLKDVIANFLEYIQFHKIPTNVLMKEIHPLDLVPPGIIMNALAYQADPTSVEPEHSPHRVRRTDRTLSVQSSPDQYDSKTTLSSSGSDAGSDQKQHSGKNSTAEQESIGEQNQSQHHQQHQPRQEPKTQKQQEEEDLQQRIEQRIQLQILRQELELKRQIEETKIQEREEELKRQQAEEAKEKEGDSKDGKKDKDKRKKSKKSKKELKKEQKKKEQEEAKELKRQQEEQEMLNKLEAEIMKKQKQEEEYMKNREKEELIKSRQREDEIWTKQKEEELRKQEKLAMQQEQIEKSRQKEEIKRQQEDAAKTREDEEKSEERRSASEEVRKEDESESKELPRQNEREKEEQQKLRRDMRLQLQLQDLKQYSVLQQQLELQKQEEALLRQIEEKRREEQREAPEFQLFQLYLEGRKPEAEKRAEERQVKELERKERKKREDRVKVRLKKPETQKRDQQDQPQELPIAAPREGVSGFYIRLVVTQGGGRNLIWLLKTHMF